VVKIAPPPPSNSPVPSFYTLDPGSKIIRIFDPTRYQTQALTFRHNGPRHRFDHHQGSITVPQDDPERGIYYAAFTLSGCLVEYFGDTGMIEIKDQCVCKVDITKPLKLLDIRGAGAMKAGSVSALAKTADRTLSQEWSRYFYEQANAYSMIDGLIYFNAHNDEKAMAIYERGKNKLACSASQVLRLDHPKLRSAIQQAAIENNLIFVA
jgi:RES domain